MKLTKEEMSLLHYSVGTVLLSQTEMNKLSDYAKDQLLKLLDKLLKEMKK